MRGLAEVYQSREVAEMGMDIYCDGATVGHNGKLGTVSEVGVGVYIAQTGERIGRRLPGISNNEAEFKALIYAMEYALRNGYTDVRFHSDSRNIINRANGKRPGRKFKNKRMDAFQDQVLNLARQFARVEFRWIPREENTIADSISKEYAIRMTHSIDEMLDYAIAKDF